MQRLFSGSLNGVKTDGHNFPVRSTGYEPLAHLLGDKPERQIVDHFEKIEITSPRSHLGGAEFCLSIHISPRHRKGYQPWPAIISDHIHTHELPI